MTSVTRAGSSDGLRRSSSAIDERREVVGAHVAQRAADVADRRCGRRRRCMRCVILGLVKEGLVRSIHRAAEQRDDFVALAPNRHAVERQPRRRALFAPRPRSARRPRESPLGYVIEFSMLTVTCPCVLRRERQRAVGEREGRAAVAYAEPVQHVAIDRHPHGRRPRRDRRRFPSPAAAERVARHHRPDDALGERLLVAGSPLIRRTAGRRGPSGAAAGSADTDPRRTRPAARSSQPSTAVEPDFVRPGEQTLRVIYPLGHREIDVLRRRDAAGTPRRPPR